MGRPRTGPSLKKFAVLVSLLIIVVVVYRAMSSMQLDLLSKDGQDRVYYEKIYSEVSDEVADWRQRYDKEVSRAENQLSSLVKVEQEVVRLREENVNLKFELNNLKDQLKMNDGA